MDARAPRPWHRKGPHLAAFWCVAIGALSFIGSIPVMSIPRMSEASRAQAEVLRLREAILMHDRIVGRLPPDLATLTAPCGQSEEGLLDSNHVTVDPWDRPWIYEVTGPRSFRVRSLGADGLTGGTGEDADLAADYP